MLELVMVMLIVGIIAAIGTSSFRYVSTSNRIAAEINALMSDLRFARAEAIKEGLFVTVCTSTDYLTCSSTGTLQGGWIVISDPSNSRTANGPPLHVQKAFSSSFNNSTDAFVVTNGFWAITFNRQGFGSNIASPTNGTVLALETTPVENKAWTRCIAISAIGLLALETTATSGQPTANAACP